VLAARDFAEGLLEELGVASSERREPRLLLTAACLSLQARTWSRPSHRDLLDLLVGFCSGVDAAAVFGASPMQFLQFAAAEISCLDPPSRLEVLKLSVRAAANRVFGNQLKSGGSSKRGIFTA